MLGWILLGIAIAAVGVVVIAGVVSKSSIKEVMQEQEMKNAIITAIDKCDNRVTLKDLQSGKSIEIKGDGIDKSLKEREKIYA